MLKPIFALLLSASIVFSIWSGYHLYELSQQENEYKYDYAEVNKLKYGLFNLEIWKEKIFDILQKKVGGFQLKSSDFNTIQKEVEKYLESLHEEYFASGKIVEWVMAEGKNEKNALAKIMMGLFKGGIEKQIDKIDFKSKIPGLAAQLTNELKKKAPEIQKGISKQISKMIAAEAGRELGDNRDRYLAKYEVSKIDELSDAIYGKVETLRADKKKWIQWSLIGLGVALLLLLLGKSIIDYKHSMTWMTLICTVFLGLGLALPMIDLDARLSEVDLTIMEESIHFDEQVMYFQSKSIIDVTKTLLEGKGIDLKLVGLLILLFSIVLPFAKMLLTTFYLYIDRAKQNPIVRTVIFYLGKWSMADVFVVAIFMSYIGFYGLISAQLGDMERQTDLYTLETINYSKLSPGIIFFTLYCIFSILMSTIIHRKDKKSYI